MQEFKHTYYLVVKAHLFNRVNGWEFCLIFRPCPGKSLPCLPRRSVMIVLGWNVMYVSLGRSLFNRGQKIRQILFISAISVDSSDQGERARDFHHRLWKITSGFAKINKLVILRSRIRYNPPMLLSPISTEASATTIKPIPPMFGGPITLNMISSDSSSAVEADCVLCLSCGKAKGKLSCQSCWSCRGICMLCLHIPLCIRQDKKDFIDFLAFLPFQTSVASEWWTHEM